jgi:hypothetical protein
MRELSLFANKGIERRLLQIQECGLPMKYGYSGTQEGDVIGFVGGFPELEVDLDQDSFNLGPRPEKNYKVISHENHLELYKSLLKACGKSARDIPVFTYDDLCVHIIPTPYSYMRFLMPKRKFSD